MRLVAGSAYLAGLAMYATIQASRWQDKPTDAAGGQSPPLPNPNAGLKPGATKKAPQAIAGGHSPPLRKLAGLLPQAPEGRKTLAHGALREKGPRFIGAVKEPQLHGLQPLNRGSPERAPSPGR